MTLVDLNPIEITFIIDMLRLQKEVLDIKLSETTSNGPREIQSIIYKLEKALEEESEESEMSL